MLSELVRVRVWAAQRCLYAVLCLYDGKSGREMTGDVGVWGACVLWKSDRIGGEEIGSRKRLVMLSKGWKVFRLKWKRMSVRAYLLMKWWGFPIRRSRSLRSGCVPHPRTAVCSSP